MERVPTGIPGLDELIEGGLPKRSVVLLSGGPGTGKTTFGIQYLIGGAKNGENGAFISLEEDVDRIMMNMSRYNWDLKRYIDEKKIVITRMEVYSFDTLKGQIENLIDRFGIKRLVIDSLTIIGFFFKDVFKLRRGIFEISDSLKKLDVTTIMTSEVPAESYDKISTFGVEEFAVDGVIRLYRMRKGNVYLRYLSIIKMRGTKHSDKMHPIEFTPDGIVVYPTEEAIF